MEKYTYKAIKNAPSVNRAGRRRMMLVLLTRLCPMPLMKLWCAMLLAAASSPRKTTMTREGRDVY